MSRLEYCGSIALTVFVLSLCSSRPVEAQAFIAQHPGLVSDVITGVEYDRVNQAHAEKRLRHVEAKLRRDNEQGNFAGVERDVCRIDNLRYRIAVDEWLIRKNLLLDPGYYPIRTDAETLAIIAQAARPPDGPDFSRPVSTPVSMATTPTISVTIVNAEPTGPGVAFDIDGVTHQAAGGSRQELAVASGSHITYDGGGTLGRHRYLIPQGRYEFRSTAEGWALYKLPSMP